MVDHQQRQDTFDRPLWLTGDGQLTQLRCEPRAQKLYAEARRDHTKKGAMRILKRQLSNVVWKRMVADVQRRSAMGNHAVP